MKKKATSSSSERSSFQSLKEAKDFVERSFEELLHQLDEFYKWSRSFWSGRLMTREEYESLQPVPDPIASCRKELAQLHKLEKTILQSCSEICIFDAFGESDEFFKWISEELDKCRWYLQKKLDRYLEEQKKTGPHKPYIIGFPSLRLFSDIKQRAELEKKMIIRGLPGFLAYQNSKEQSKPKKNRNPEAIKKEKDFLYLLDQYDRWKTKTSEVTGRKKLNPKDWLQEYDRWNNKTLAIYRKYVSIKSKDGTLRESDPSSKDAQGRIDSIIKYAQKIKRERSERDE
jgi:hypothetical protein